MSAWISWDAVKDLVEQVVEDDSSPALFDCGVGKNGETLIKSLVLCCRT